MKNLKRRIGTSVVVLAILVALGFFMRIRRVEGAMDEIRHHGAFLDWSSSPRTQNWYLRLAIEPPDFFTVTEVTMDQAKLEQVIEIPDPNWIRYVHINSVRTELDIRPLLRRFHRLQVITLSGIHLSPNSVEAIGSMAELTDINVMRDFSNTELAKLLIELPSLTVISLNVSIDDVELESLSGDKKIYFSDGWFDRGVFYRYRDYPIEFDQ